MKGFTKDDPRAVAAAQETPAIKSADDVLFMLGESAGPGQEPTRAMADAIWALMDGASPLELAVRCWERGQRAAQETPEALLTTLKALRDACVRADSIGELSMEVDGTMLDAATAAIAKAESRWTPPEPRLPADPVSPATPPGLEALVHALKVERSDLDAALAEHAALVALVEAQAGDAGLWFAAQTAPEAYLQHELRRLHAAIESLPAQETPLGLEALHAEWVQAERDYGNEAMQRSGHATEVARARFIRAKHQLAAWTPPAAPVVAEPSHVIVADTGKLIENTSSPVVAEPDEKHRKATAEMLRAVLANYDLFDPIHGLGRDVDEAVRWALAAVADETPTSPVAPAPADLVARLVALVRQWRAEADAYPDNECGLYGASAVRLCANEIEALTDTN